MRIFGLLLVLLAREPTPASEEFTVILERTGKGSGRESGLYPLGPAPEGVWTVHRFPLEANTPDRWFSIFRGDAAAPHPGAVRFDDFFVGEFPSSPSRPR